MSIPVDKVVRNPGEVFGVDSVQKQLIAASGRTYGANVVEALRGILVGDPINATNEKGEAWRYPVSVNGMLFNLKVSGAMRQLKPMTRVVMRDVTLGLMPNGRGVWVKAESINEMESK